LAQQLTHLAQEQLATSRPPFGNPAKKTFTAQPHFSRAYPSKPNEIPVDSVHSTSEATVPVNLETGQRSGGQVTFCDYNEIVVD
jgi:hypothetical protein